MDNPQQVLLHLTSRGAKVRTLEQGAIGKFTNMATQPINNINKYGLLHYSIPKQMDLLNDANRSFTLRIRFHSGKFIDIPVILPAMDYYGMRLDYATDDAGLPSFAEVLQTSINWAIQKYWTRNKAAFNAVLFVDRGQKVCNRLGCIVKVTNDKRLQIIVGWRGSPVPKEITAGDAGILVWRWYDNGDGDDAKMAIQNLTGAPVLVQPEAKITARNFRGVVGNNAMDNPDYNFIDTDGDQHEQSPADAIGQDTDWNNCKLYRIELRGLSNRLQLMLGAPGPDIASPTEWLQQHWTDPDTAAPHTGDALIVERGRMILVNYRGYNRADRLGLLDLTFNIPPNLSGPSFMFLQLTAQGTKSKVLGHAAERGGWSIPTSSNGFTSKFDNFPGYQQSGMHYDILDVRQCPALLNHSEFLRETVKDLVTNKTNDGAMAHRFDQIPFDPLGVVFETAVNVKFYELHNFALKPNAQFRNADANNPYTNHRFGSRMIHYGDLETMTALAEIGPRVFAGGVDSLQESPTFTVSMIDPNWIYTDVPNSTVQSISMQLMWGDTNKNVEEVSGYPVQFTMIASQ